MSVQTYLLSEVEDVGGFDIRTMLGMIFGTFDSVMAL